MTISRRNFLKKMIGIAGFSILGGTGFIWQALNSNAQNDSKLKEEFEKVASNLTDNRIGNINGYDMWKNIFMYEGNPDYDLSIPFKHLNNYCESESITPDDYQHIYQEIDNILICFQKITEKYKERRNSISNPTENISEHEWKSLLKNTEINRETLEKGPEFLGNILTKIITKAKLEIYKDNTNTNINQVNNFVKNLKNKLKNI